MSNARRGGTRSAADEEKIWRVPCRFCGAIAGEACRNGVTGGPLIRFPAHSVRMKDAEK